MSIPNYLMALANHQGPAKIYAGGMVIPVKIMDIAHEEDWNREETTFKCLVVNQDEIRCDKLNGYTAPSTRSAKEILNAVYGVGGMNDYVRQSLAKSAAKQAVREAKCATVNPFEIKRVIFSDPATIVLWADGTKTIVKCQEGDVYSKETGLALCFTKKALGNKSNFNDVFHEWIPEEGEVVKPEVPTVNFNGSPLSETARKLAEAMMLGGRHE